MRVQGLLTDRDVAVKQVPAARSMDYLLLCRKQETVVCGNSTHILKPAYIFSPSLSA